MDKKKCVFTFIVGEIRLEMTNTEAEHSAETGIFKLPSAVSWTSLPVGMPGAKVENFNAVKPSRGGQARIIHGGINTDSDPFLFFTIRT